MNSRVYPHGQPIHAFANLTATTAAFSWFDDQGKAVTFAAKDRIVVDNAIFTQAASGGTSYPALVEASSPLSYWRLNETHGTVAADLGSLANPGTYEGTYALSVQPGAIMNDGSGAWQNLEAVGTAVDVPDNPGYGGAIVTTTVIDDPFNGTANQNIMSYIPPGYSSSSPYFGYFGAGTNFQSLYNNGGGSSGFQIAATPPGLTKAAGGNTQCIQLNTSITIPHYQVAVKINPVAEATVGVGPTARLAAEAGAHTGDGAVVLVYASSVTGTGTVTAYQNNASVGTANLSAAQADWTASHTIMLDVTASGFTAYVDGTSMFTVANTTGNAQTYAGFVEVAPATPNVLISEFKIQTFAIGAYNITVETWHKPVDAMIIGTLLSKTISDAGNTQYQLQFASNHVRTRMVFAAAGAVTVASSTAISLNVWHHFAATYDGSTITVYQDGVSVATHSITDTLVSGTGDVYLGNLEAALDSSINGNLQEVAIYGTALSSTVIASHYAAGIAGGPLTIFYDNTGMGTATAKGTIYEGSPTGVVSVVRGNSIGFSGSINGATPAVYYTYSGTGATVLLLGRRLTT